MSVRTHEPESCASANSAIPANAKEIIAQVWLFVNPPNEKRIEKSGGTGQWHILFDILASAFQTHNEMARRNDPMPVLDMPLEKLLAYEDYNEFLEELKEYQS